MAGGSATLTLPTTTLKIDGVTKGPADGVTVAEWSWDLDSDAEASFYESASDIVAPSYHGGQVVTIELGATLYFTGEISSVDPIPIGDDWTFGYRARGWKYRLNQLPVTASDGTGKLVFNLPPDDDDYIATQAGLSVGDVIDAVLTLHASALSALGISTDATTTSQLAALTLVPPEPVYLSGRLGQAIDGVLRDWAKNVVAYYTPAGVLRLIDTTAAGTTLTLTEGTDVFEPARFKWNVEDCASRVQVRGRGKIYPFFASLLSGTLDAAWTGGQQTAWTWNDFTSPTDATDAGTVGSVLSSTSVRITSSDAAKARAADFYSDRQAWIYLMNSAGSGITFQEARPITTHTAQTAGNSYDVTLGFPLENAGSSAYDSFRLAGRAGVLGDGSASELVDVWRLFDVTDPGGLVADHLVKRFPAPVAFFGYYGDSEVSTYYPSAVVVSSSGATFPVSFKIVPETGQIRFDEPICRPFNTQTDLNTGGASVVAPDDLYVLLAYSRGALTATYPPDSGGPVYAGTVYSAFNMQRTAYIDVDSWLYQGDQTQFDDLAEMHWKALSDVVYEGTRRVYGCYSACLDGSALLRLDVSNPGIVTGEESLAVPIRGFSLRYHADASGGMLHSSTLRCSSKRNPTTGDRLYVHPTRLDQLVFKLPTMGSLDLRGSLDAYSPPIDAATYFA